MAASSNLNSDFVLTADDRSLDARDETDEVGTCHWRFQHFVSAVMRTSEEIAMRLEDIPEDHMILVELPNKPRYWMSPENASREEIIAYIQSMQTDPTCHMRYAAADVCMRPIRELDKKTLPARLRLEVTLPQ